MPLGKLYLLPNLLSTDAPPELFFPAKLSWVVSQLQGLIVEDEKEGRRYLRTFLSSEEMRRVPLLLLNEHTADLAPLVEPLLRGEVWGLISDAGLPCIADPGAPLVREALGKGVKIEAISGPCSITLALQLSGLSGQSFTFHGYLPREEGELKKRFAQIQEMAFKGVTQIWIEAPYRSDKMLQFLKEEVRGDLWLAFAASLTSPHERVVSQRGGEWRHSKISLGKEAAVFLLGK